MTLFDTHCHLTHPLLKGDAGPVLRRADEAGVRTCLTVGTGIEDGRRALEAARSEPGRVVAAAAIDPFTAHERRARFDEDLAELERMLRGGGFVALGEAGLDYHHDLDPREDQARRFEVQLDLASRLDLPVIVHVREAHNDLIAILERHPSARGVVHAFVGDSRTAERYLALGWHLGIGGIATFAGSTALREAIARIPADRLLTETDSPYLAPVPVRGKRCEPAFLVHTVGAIARNRGESLATTGANAAAAARRLFGAYRAEAPEVPEGWEDGSPLLSRSWDGLAELPALVRSEDGGPARWPTRVSVGHGEAWYFRFDCEDPEVVATIAERDGDLWTEDVVEVFLSPGEDTPLSYVEIEVNPNGALFDARVDHPGGRRAEMTVDRAWNADGIRWESSRDDARRRWSAAIALPLSAFGSRGSSRIWRANAYRIERGAPGGPEHTAWSPTWAVPADFHRPARFGLLHRAPRNRSEGANQSDFRV